MYTCQESMLENDQRYLVEISPMKFRSEEVFILTSEYIYIYIFTNTVIL